MGDAGQIMSWKMHLCGSILYIEPKSVRYIVPNDKTNRWCSDFYKILLASEGSIFYVKSKCIRYIVPNDKNKHVQISIKSYKQVTAIS